MDTRQYENAPADKPGFAVTRKKKMNIYALAGIIAAVCMIAGGVALYFVISIYFPAEKSREEKWEVKNINGFSLEIPFEIEQAELNDAENLKEYIKEGTTYTYKDESFVFAVNYFEYKSGVTIDIEAEANGTLQGELTGLQSSSRISNFRYQIDKISKGGPSGRLISARYMLNGRKARTSGVLYSQAHKLWIVQCMYLDKGINRKIAERIIYSAKITDNNYE